MTTSEKCYRIIEAIYQKYNPDKVSDCSALVKKYKGNEQELLNSIFTKYNIDATERAQLIEEALTIVPDEKLEKSNFKIEFIVSAIILTLLLFYIIYDRNAKQHDILEVKSDTLSASPTGTSQYVMKKLTIPNSIDKEERAQILDALRTPIEMDLHQEVKFVVNNIQKCDNWVLIYAKPVKENGAPVDYEKTEYQQWIDEGMFDEGILALLKFKNEQWIVAEYRIGGTDDPIPGWIDKYDLENCKNSLGLY